MFDAERKPKKKVARPSVCCGAESRIRRVSLETGECVMQCSACGQKHTHTLGTTPRHPRPRLRVVK